MKIPTRFSVNRDGHQMAIILLGLVTSLVLAGCPPTLPCDEKIADPAVYENLVLSNPVIQDVSTELTVRSASASPCFVNDQVGVGLVFVLPASYSEFGLVYSDYLGLSYRKDGVIFVSGGLTQPAAFEKDAVLTYFKSKVQQVESSSRIREVITKTGPHPYNQVLPLFGMAEIFRDGDNRIEYNFCYGQIRGYCLSNQIDWQEFPEIRQAHRIMEDHLLVGPLSGCQIGRGEMHNYTCADFHDSSASPWYLTVALICDDGWKDAYVQINPDGSYERLEIQTEYHNQ